MGRPCGLTVPDPLSFCPPAGALDPSLLSPAPDWARPWFTPWARAGQDALALHATGQPLTDALNAAGDAPVRFVPPDALPPGAAYEHFIFQHAAVPTRTGWHDFFNALAWCAWPRTKAACNRLHLAELHARTAAGLPGRGPRRDALTQFDECGIVVVSSDTDLLALLAAHEWEEALWTRRARLRISRVDPWSVMKTSFLFSIAFGIMCWVAVYVVWTVVQTSGMFEAVNRTLTELLSSPSDQTPVRIEDYVNTNKVMGVTALLSVINVVLMTALGTIFAFLYNLSANILGGLELTLAED